MSENQTRAADRPAQAMKDFAQQGADYSKSVADKSEAMATAAGKSMQQTYSAAATEAANFNVQMLEMIRDNANASLDLAQRLVTAKTPTEFFEVSAAYTRKQFESLTQQAQQLAGLAQKATAHAMKPMQSGMKNVFDKAA